MKKTTAPAAAVPFSSEGAALVWRNLATWGPLGRLSAILFCVFMATGMVSALVPLRVLDVTHDYGRLAIIATAYSAVGILGGYGWGWVSDRWGRRTPLLALGLGGLTLAYAGYLVAGSFAALLLVRVVEGASLAAYNVGSVALMGDYVADRADRGRLLGAYRTFGSLAFGITMLTSGTIADRFGSLIPFLCSASFVGVGVLLALGLREAPVHGAAREKQTAGAASTAAPTLDQRKAARLASSLLASLLVGTVAWNVVMAAVYSVWPNYLASVGYQRAGITRLWALASLSEVPFMIVAGSLTDRLGRRRMLALSLVLVGLVFTGYVVVPHLPWVAVVQVVRAMGYSAFLTASLALTVEASSYARRGRISGLVSTLGAVGSVSGNSLGGTLVKASGFTALLSTGTAAAFAGAILVMTGALWPLVARDRASQRTGTLTR